MDLTPPDTADSLPALRSGLTVHPLEGELIIYDPACDTTHRLNQTAHEIWRMWRGRSDAAAVAAALRRSYDVAPEQARHDVEAVAHRLWSLGLIERPLPC